MIARTYTAACLGMDVYPIEVEVDGKQGIPQFILIGLASRAVEEAKERITSALSNCGIRIRSKRTVVNLAPASVPKSGTAFDLAIVVGLLKMYGELKWSTDRTLFFGELALDGQIKPVPGALPLVLKAQSLGFEHVVLPQANVAEVGTVRSVKIFPIQHLAELLDVEAHRLPLVQLTPQSFPQVALPHARDAFDQIIGMERAKRALVLAAAGGHHVLLTGSPGSGKTRLASAVQSLLPPLSEQESIESTTIFSLAGLTGNGLQIQRPFRAPHHSISRTGLLGGGNPLRPGEISLACHGVLFLDELLEFPSSLLDMLRQPLEEKKVSLSFHSGRTSFPAVTTLIAATNPCPCGYFGSSQKACICSPRVIEKYRQKLSGPLLDRFDISILVDHEPRLFSDENHDTATNDCVQQIANCRKLQQRRYAKYGWSAVSQLSSQQFADCHPLSQATVQHLQRAALAKNMTGRGYWATAKLARTLADLAESSQIQPQHIQEAAAFRELQT